MNFSSRRFCTTFVIVAACFQFSGCASPPPVRFHSLLALDAVQLLPTSGPELALNLTSVSIPAQVDQAQWLVRNADGSLSLLEQERWVAPLRGELQAALLDRWANAWGFRSPLAVGNKDAAWRVSVQVLRWDALPGREVRLESRWTATAGALVLSCSSLIREPAAAESGGLALSLAASHRRAVSRLADEVASRINATQKGGPLGCGEGKA